MGLAAGGAGPRACETKRPWNPLRVKEVMLYQPGPGSVRSLVKRISASVSGFALENRQPALAPIAIESFAGAASYRPGGGESIAEPSVMSSSTLPSWRAVCVHEPLVGRLGGAGPQYAPGPRCSRPAERASGLTGPGLRPESANFVPASVAECRLTGRAGAYLVKVEICSDRLETCAAGSARAVSRKGGTPIGRDPDSRARRGHETSPLTRPARGCGCARP